MRILQIVHSLPFLNQAGTELHTYNLSLELSKRHQVYIFARVCNTRQKDYEITKKNLNGIVVYLINNTFKYCDSFEMYYRNDAIDRRFTELLDEIRPDVVHIQHLVFLSIGLIRIIKDRGIPIIFTLHDYWLMCPRWHILKKDLTPCNKVFNGNFDEECLGCVGEMLNIKGSAKNIYSFCKRLLPAFAVNRLKRMYFAFAQKITDNDLNINKLKERSRRIKVYLKSIDYFIAPSEYLRNKFINFGIPAERIRLSRNGLNKVNKIRFAFIGTILPAKGLHILIEAFNRIDYRIAQLDIYGKFRSYTGFEDYLPYLKKIAKNKNIRYRGEFNHSEIAGIFKEIDVLIVPSIWYENCPQVIQEAFLFKTPVIASRIGGIPELINDGIDGLLFNAGDINDLSAKMRYLVENSDVIERFRGNMPKIKSIEDNARETEELYNILAKAKPMKSFGN